MKSKGKSIFTIILVGVFMVVFGLLSFLPVNSGYYKFSAALGSLTHDGEINDNSYAEFKVEAIDDGDSSTVDTFDIDEVASKITTFVKSYDSSANASAANNDVIRIVLNYDANSTQGIINAFDYHKVEVMPKTIVEKDSSAADYQTSYDMYVLTSEHISTVEVGVANNAYAVKITADSTGKKILKDATSKYSSEAFYVMFDGEQYMQIGSMSSITDGVLVLSSSSMERGSAFAFATQMYAGSLGAKLTLNNYGTVESMLTDRFVTKLVIATLVAFIVASIAIIVYYRLAGLMLVLSLISFAIMYLIATVTIFEYYLSVATVIALVISMILLGSIWERGMNAVRAEYVNNPLRSPIAIVNIAFKKAMLPLIDCIVALVFATFTAILLGIGMAQYYCIIFTMAIILGTIAILIALLLIKACLGINDKNLPLMGFGKKVDVEEVA